MQTKLFINGEFVDAAAGGTIAVLNPYDNSPICEIAEARAEDVDMAVEAATKAAERLARGSDPSQRGRLLLKLADAIEADGEDLIQLESRDTGHPVRDARKLDVPRTAACFRYFGGMADKFEGFLPPVYPGYLNYVSREPVGVVGQIVPWNFPLMFTSWKMAPALAAGNTVVIKPAGTDAAFNLAHRRIDEARLAFPRAWSMSCRATDTPPARASPSIPTSRRSRLPARRATGRRIVQASASNLKKVQLELGGKGPNIVFADASIPAAVAGSAWAIFHNQGQACIAGSRLILHEKIADEFLQRFIALREVDPAWQPAR